MLSWLMGNPLKIKPLLVSKLNTVAQIVFACVVLGSLGVRLCKSTLVKFVLMGLVGGLDPAVGRRLSSPNGCVT